MAKTHWRKLTNPNYLGAYSIDDGNDLILTIAYVRQEEVVGTDGKKDDCVVCHFKERNVKPMILNSTNMKTITKVVGSPYIDDWAGNQIQIGTEIVKAFGSVVDALRVRPYKPKAAVVVKCEKCGADIKPGHGMTSEQMAAYTRKKYGAALCAGCATEANKAAQNAKKSEADNVTADNTDSVTNDSAQSDGAVNADV